MGPDAPTVVPFGWLLLVAAAVGSAVWVFLAPSPPASRLREIKRTDGAAVRWHGDRTTVVLAAALAALILGSLLGGAATPVLGLTAVVAAVLRWGLRRRQAAREAERTRLAVLELVAALAAELRSGAPPSRALGTVADEAGALQPAVTELARAAALGADVVPGLHALACRPGARQLAWLATCWQVSTLTGSGMAPALESLSAALREREHARTEVAASLAGPRATVRVLLVLPAFGVLLSTGLGANPLSFLFGTPAGWLLLTVALALDGLGLAWTGWLVRRAEGR